MRHLLLLVIHLFFFLESFGQDTFVRFLSHTNADSNPEVVATPDLGWVVYSPDSFLLYKFNSCGVLQWAKRYHIAASNYSGLDFFIGTREKGFAFLAMLEDPAGRYTQLVNLDSAGKVLWTKVFKDNLYEQITYSLGQDALGNFMIYGMASIIGGGEVFNMLSKVSKEGNYLWTRFYNHGGIWGGGICTSDTGFLARTGNVLIKLDREGQVQWTSLFQIGSQFYYAPLEVSDGYLMPCRSNSNAEYAVAKLTKTGTPAWQHKKVLKRFSQYPKFRNCPNGNLATVANSFINFQRRYGVMEFTPDLSFVRHTVARMDNSFLLINAYNLTFRKDGVPLLAGILNIGDFVFLPNLFFAKMDQEFKTGCDTSFAPPDIVTEPVAVIPLQTISSLHPFRFENKPLLVTNLSAETYFLCGQPPPLQVRLAGDSILCHGETGKLKPESTSGFDQYQWSNGQTTTEILITSPGKYWLKATNSCREESATDTIEVIARQFPAQKFAPEYLLCPIDSLVLNAQVPLARYLWNNGDTTSTLVASKPGTYSVTLTSAGCRTEWKTVLKECEELDIPNAFTPNGDKVNDRFVAGKWKGISEGKLKIFNRWGQKIFTTTDFKNTGWGGEDHQPGVYYWALQYSTAYGVIKTLNGTIWLIR